MSSRSIAKLGRFIKRSGIRYSVARAPALFPTYKIILTPIIL